MFDYSFIILWKWKIFGDESSIYILSSWQYITFEFNFEHNRLVSTLLLAFERNKNASVPDGNQNN